MKCDVRVVLFVAALWFVQVSLAQSVDTKRVESVSSSAMSAIVAAGVPENALQAMNVFAQGNTKAKENNFNGAIADFSRAIVLFPDYADAYFRRGRMRLDVRDYHGALDDYTTVLRLQPNNLEAFNNRAIAKLKLNDFKGGG